MDSDRHTCHDVSKTSIRHIAGKMTTAVMKPLSLWWRSCSPRAMKPLSYQENPPHEGDMLLAPSWTAASNGEPDILVTYGKLTILSDSFCLSGPTQVSDLKLTNHFVCKQGQIPSRSCPGQQKLNGEYFMGFAKIWRGLCLGSAHLSEGNFVQRGFWPDTYCLCCVGGVKMPGNFGHCCVFGRDGPACVNKKSH